MGIGPKMPLPDKVEILEPKQFKQYDTPVGIPYGVEAQEEQLPVDPDSYDQQPEEVGAFEAVSQDYGQPPAQEYRQQPEVEPQIGYDAPEAAQQPPYQTPG